MTILELQVQLRTEVAALRQAVAELTAGLPTPNPGHDEAARLASDEVAGRARRGSFADANCA